MVRLRAPSVNLIRGVTFTIASEMESSEEPRSKLLKSNSFEDQRPRSAGSVNYGAGPGSSRRTVSASNTVNQA